MKYFPLISQKHCVGMFALAVVAIFGVTGIYAPLLASSKPLVVIYNKEIYFPLFRYLFYQGFFTSRLDLFFNLLMFTLPCMLLALRKKILLYLLITAHILIFFYLAFRQPSDPEADPNLTFALQDSWQQEVKEMSRYARLNEVLRYRLQYQQHMRLLPYYDQYREHMLQRGQGNAKIPTLWQMQEDHDWADIQSLTEQLKKATANQELKQELHYLLDKRCWLLEQNQQISFIVMPLLRPYHWQDDAGGEQALNQYLPWWELTRSDRKDLSAALIFGVRISIVVGFLAIALALLIGVPVGAISGFYGGYIDILLSRVMEIWEAMPTFFMLLLVISILQSKSIFLVIAIIGLFGWTGFSRYIRSEFLKQRNLSYVEACKTQGFNNRYIIFSHILPNAISPLLTLLPFAIMGAISAEAGLSFLGLGEEGSCSWGVLMDEGRRAFPGESYLLWPPAVLLTLLLISIALTGDAIRDAIDPKRQ